MPLHLITGDIPGLISSHVSRLIQEFDQKSQAIPVDERLLWDELSNQSLWSDAQVLLLNNPSASFPKALESHKDLFTDNDDLVIVTSAKSPVALKRAIEGLGGVIKEFSRRNYKKVASELLSKSGLPAGVQQQIIKGVGQDVERIPSIIASLKTLPDASLKYEHVVQAYIGLDGGVPMWGVLDAIDAGVPKTALTELHRVSEPPIVVHAAIIAHIQRIFQVRNLSPLSVSDIAKTLGVKGSTYPLQKASNLLPRYSNVETMLALCVKAGADLRGGSPLPGNLILEILVGRLCLLTQIGKA